MSATAQIHCLAFRARCHLSSVVFPRRVNSYSRAAPRAKISHHPVAHAAREDDVFYSYSGLDRVADRRTDVDWLKSEFESPHTKLVLVSEGRCLVRDRQAHFMNASELRLLTDATKWEDVVFLGQEGKTTLFAVDTSHCQLQSPPSEWVNVRSEGPSLPAPEASILAYASSLLQWRNSTRFCSLCAAPLAPSHCGHVLRCSSPSCGQTHYPRLDPAVIMRVSLGEYVLLGRQSRWPPGRFSLLAGFVELGETFEQAVGREVAEESGVALNPASISYFSSQPWPFPRSLMVGFCASAEPRDVPPGGLGEPPEVVGERGQPLAYPLGARAHLLEGHLALPPPQVDQEELEDARWFHRAFIRSIVFPEASAQPSQGVQVSIPGRYALARGMLERWVEEGAGPTWRGSEVPEVLIDSGKFKYVLLQLSDSSSGHSKLIVRGDRRAPFHMDVLSSARREAAPLHLTVTPLGGGRIEHLAEVGVLSVFGFSQAFGMADHRLTAAILHKWFPLHEIHCSNEGY